MAYITTQAFVLKRIDLGENDSLLTLLTSELGLVKAVMKSVRKPGAKLPSLSEPFILSEIMLYKRPAQEFYKVTQVKFLDGLPGLRTDLAKIGAASTMAELLLETIHGEEKNLPLFGTVWDAFRQLSLSDRPYLFSLCFTFQWLSLLGYKPHLEDCILCHKSLKSTEIYFSSHHGGALCPDCAKRTASGARILTKESLRLVEEACAGRFPAPGAEPPQEQMSDLETLVQENTLHHCGKELNSLTFFKKISVPLLVLCGFLFFFHPLRGYGSGTTAPDSLKLEMGARAVGMGSAYTATGDEAHAIFWNPAELVRIEGCQTVFSHHMPFMDTTNDYGAVVFPLPSQLMLGVSFLFSAMAPFPEINATGQTVGTVEAADTVTGITISKPLDQALAVGATVKYFASKLYVYQASGVAFDFGILSRFNVSFDRLFVGASLTNLGTGIRYLSDMDPLPSKARAGLGYIIQRDDNHRHVIGLDAEVPMTPDERKIFSMGYEWWAMRLIYLRAGYRLGPPVGNLTIGMGFTFGGWQLDYATVPFDTLGSTHRFSLQKNWK